MMTRPTASYRLQLTPSNGFDAARRHLDRLHGLGISHVYLSPVTEALPGSTHGYDVVDHTRVRDELGGLDGLTALLDALADRRMAAVIDHVPNHMAVDRAALNRPWWEMLRDGPDSPGARWFDVDWAAAGGKVLLPVLGAPLDEAMVELDADAGELHLGELRFPLAPGTSHFPVEQALARQHYQLLHWRRPERNVRRFFTIDSLAAVRVEHAEVAAAVDTVPRLLAAHPGFGGVRVDHVDGLADPQAYLRGLRDVVGDRWLLVEKILAPGEALPTAWPVDGTTGYEHARVVEHALLDPRTWPGIAARWTSATGDARPFREWEVEAKGEVLGGGLRPDRDRVAALAATAVPQLGKDEAAPAVTELSARLRRYRTYLPDDAEGRLELDAALRESSASRPDLAGAIERLVDGIVTARDEQSVELRTRWQQLTGPATAKGVEDRAFWRYIPLASLGEVGGRPAPEPDAIAALHRHHHATNAEHPMTMLAGTTHDAARSEDVRAFGLALAGGAEHWVRVLDEWVATAAFPDIDVPMQWLALQTAATTPELSANRLDAFLVKAAREADWRTSWTNPDDEYERRLGALAHDVLAWPPLVEFAASLDRPGRAVSLAMLAVRATAPGVPDVYQGTEAFRFLLVDPDNRQEPDEAALDELTRLAADVDARAAWADPEAPLARVVVLRRLLELRAAMPDVFGPGGGYRPLAVDGPAAQDVIAFARLAPGGEAGVVTIVSRSPSPAAAVSLPPGSWRHVLIDDEPDGEGRIDIGPVLDAFPAVVLVRR